MRARWGLVKQEYFLAAGSITIPFNVAGKHYVRSYNAATMIENSSAAKERVPIFLLKTKSIPNDGYEEQFSTVQEGGSFEPIFVPVLEHKFLEEGLEIVKRLLQKKQIGKDCDSKYGGLIFTSQRAVEAFSKLVDEGKGADHH